MTELYIVLLSASRLSRNLPRNLGTNDIQPCTKWRKIYASISTFLTLSSKAYLKGYKMTFKGEKKLFSPLIILEYMNFEAHIVIHS